MLKISKIVICVFLLLDVAHASSGDMPKKLFGNWIVVGPVTLSHIKFVSLIGIGEPDIFRFVFTCRGRTKEKPDMVAESFQLSFQDMPPTVSNGYADLTYMVDKNKFRTWFSGVNLVTTSLGDVKDIDVDDFFLYENLKNGSTLTATLKLFDKSEANVATYSGIKLKLSRYKEARDYSLKRCGEL